MVAGRQPPARPRHGDGLSEPDRGRLRRFASVLARALAQRLPLLARSRLRHRRAVGRPHRRHLRPRLGDRLHRRAHVPFGNGRGGADAGTRTRWRPAPSLVMRPCGRLLRHSWQEACSSRARCRKFCVPPRRPHPCFRAIDVRVRRESSFPPARQSGCRSRSTIPDRSANPDESPSKHYARRRLPVSTSPQSHSLPSSPISYQRPPARGSTITSSSAISRSNRPPATSARS